MQNQSTLQACRVWDRLLSTQKIHLHLKSNKLANVYNNVIDCCTDPKFSPLIYLGNCNFNSQIEPKVTLN